MSEDTKPKLSMQQLGGLARAKKLTKEQKQAAGRKGGNAKATRGLPKATHDGKLKFGDMEIDCYVIPKGEENVRMISSNAFRAAMGLTKADPRSREKSKASGLPTFLVSDSLSRYVSEILDGRDGFILFADKNGRKIDGIEATLLPAICEIYLKARSDGSLMKNQIKIAAMAETILISLAKIGVVALVDEATGFQEDRARHELQTLLKKFINEDLLKWTQRFPHSFFREVFRLHGWAYRPGKCCGPQYLGKFINKYVYDAISPEVHEELRKKNPVQDNGRRASAHHQWLSQDVGIEALDTHLKTIGGLLKISRSKEEFDGMFNRLKDADTYEKTI